MTAFTSAPAAISKTSSSVLSACKAKNRCGIETPSLLMLLSGEAGGRGRGRGGVKNLDMMRARQMRALQHSRESGICVGARFNKHTSSLDAACIHSSTERCRVETTLAFDPIFEGWGSSSSVSNMPSAIAPCSPHLISAFTSAPAAISMATNSMLPDCNT
jgi:hypothetical protein